MFAYSVHFGSPLGVAGLLILFLVPLIFIKVTWWFTGWLTGIWSPWPHVRPGYFLALGAVIVLYMFLSLVDEI